MTRTRALVAASFLLGAVAACGQAPEPSDTPETPTPPDVVDTSADTSTPASEDSDVVEVEAEERLVDPNDLIAAVASDDEGHDHGEEHNHEDEHSHDEDHDHAHENDDHDHDHEHDHDDHRHGGEAHVHGAAEFVLATTDTGAEAEFNSPLFNLIGFEHEPKTPEQEAALSTLVDTLADASRLFVTSEDAGCSTIDSMINVERDGDHSALSASYLMTCSDPSAIEAIELTAFSSYANMDSIDVVFVGGANQSAGTVTPESPTFAIGG